MDIDELLKITERWNDFRVTKDITSYGTPDAYIKDFIKQNGEDIRNKISEMGNKITPIHFQTYLSQFEAFMKKAPDRALSDIRGRRELEKILAETKKVQLDAFPISTIYKVSSTISVGFIAAGSTIITAFYNGISDHPSLSLIPGILFTIGLILLYWGLSKLNADEQKKNELFKRLFPELVQAQEAPQR